MPDAIELQNVSPAARHTELAITRDPAANAIVELLKSPDALKNVEAMGKLTDLYLKLKANAAEEEFARAFNALQAELEPVKAMKPVMNSADKGGGLRYLFAPFEDIMAQVRPLLLKHGFTLSFSSETTDGRVTQHCTLQHIGGHKKTNTFGARIGRGPPGASETQGDGAASTYAKRFALCDCLNITIEKDNDGQQQDARAEGSPITQDQISYLREQIKELGGEAANASFFALAGVKPGDYANIMSGAYSVLSRAIEAKKKSKRA